MPNTPEKDYYEIIDIKRQSDDQREQEMPNRKINSSSFACAYNDINISDFESKNYGKIFKRKISPGIKQKKKSTFVKFIGILAIVYLIMLAIVVSVILIIEHFGPSNFHYSLQEDHSIFAPFIGIFSFVFFLLTIFFIFVFPRLLLEWFIAKFTPKVSDAISRSFTKPTLADIKKKFFDALQVEYYRIDEVRAQIDMMTQIMTKINPSYKKYVKTDDFISFNYDNLPLDLVEFRSVGREANSCVFIRTKINKPISCEIYIKTKETSSDSFSFADNFLVQSSNPQEARSLLTTSFRNGLIKYRKEHNNCSIDILFSNKISTRENIFICITSQKNFFEMPEADWQDPNKSYRIVDEIRELLFIVDALKLDQDIGL
jgi:hypothetical protein